MPILQIVGCNGEEHDLRKLQAKLEQAVLKVSELELTATMDVDVQFLSTRLPSTRITCQVVGLFTQPDSKRARNYMARQKLAEAIARTLKEHASKYGCEQIEVLVPPYPNLDSGYVRLGKVDIQG